MTIYTFVFVLIAHFKDEMNNEQTRETWTLKFSMLWDKVKI